LVKQFFTAHSAATPRGSRHLPQAAIAKPSLRLITSRPKIPGTAEIADNVRSRSAKLRVAEKLAA